MSAASMGPNGAELHAAAGRHAATRAIFCSPPPRRSSTICAFRWATWKRAQVRALAAELGLVTAAKPDSQDICFVPEGRYTDIVEKLRPDAARPGEIVDQAGAVLGRHDGIIHFTVGQRKGLGLSGNEEPLFVLKLDAARARVVVGPRSALALARHPSERRQLAGGCRCAVRLRRESALHAPAGGGAGRRRLPGGGGAGGTGHGRKTPSRRARPASSTGSDRAAGCWAAAGSLAPKPSKPLRNSAFSRFSAQS